MRVVFDRVEPMTTKVERLEESPRLLRDAEGLMVRARLSRSAAAIDAASSALTLGGVWVGLRAESRAHPACGVRKGHSSWALVAFLNAKAAAEAVLAGAVEAEGSRVGAYWAGSLDGGLW
jgi:hypothetical protein